MVGFKIYIYDFKLGSVFDWYLFFTDLVAVYFGIALSANDALKEYILEDSITMLLTHLLKHPLSRKCTYNTLKCR